MNDIYTNIVFIDGAHDLKSFWNLIRNIEKNIPDNVIYEFNIFGYSNTLFETIEVNRNGR